MLKQAIAVVEAVRPLGIRTTDDGRVVVGCPRETLPEVLREVDTAVQDFDAAAARGAEDPAAQALVAVLLWLRQQPGADPETAMRIASEVGGFRREDIVRLMHTSDLQLRPLLAAHLGLALDDIRPSDPVDVPVFLSSLEPELAPAALATTLAGAENVVRTLTREFEAGRLGYVVTPAPGDPTVERMTVRMGHVADGLARTRGALLSLPGPEPTPDLPRPR
jgi:hypothetical protein